MAIQEFKEKTSLKLELNAGVVDGKQKISSKSFNQINLEAANEDLYGAATTIADLQEKDLLHVKKIETSNLIEG